MRTYVKLMLFLCALQLVDMFLIEHLSEDLNKQRTAVVFGFSGLRWDSMKIVQMPNLVKLSEEGFLAERKIDVFQSQSLPSFTSFSTGLHPDKHGMVSNNMRDLSDGSAFDVTNTDPKWRMAAEPIWITNQKANNSRSALCFWPGFEIEFSGQKAKHMCPMEDDKKTYVNPFYEITTKGQISEQVMSFSTRVEYAKKWLSMGLDARPNFIAVYFEEPLQTALQYGYNSSQVKDELNNIDKIVGDFMLFLQQSDLIEKINFIVSGEAGVTDLISGNEIYLDDYISRDLLNSYKIVDNGPITTILPSPESAMALYQQLLRVNPNMDVYNSTTLPESFHFRYANRSMPLTLVANEGSQINPSRLGVKQRKALMGFDARFSSAHSLMVAHGPAFKKSVRVRAMGNVDVYQLLCECLKVKANPNDGNSTIFDKAIKLQDKWYEYIAKTIAKTKQGMTGAIIIALALFLLAIYMVIVAVYKTAGFCSNRLTIARVKAPEKMAQNSRRSKDGHKRLLADEDEISDIDIDSSDVDIEFGKK